MKNQVRAGLEVAALIIGGGLVSTGVGYALNQIEAQLGAETVVHGLVFVLLGAAIYTVVSLAYDMRVRQLESLDKVNQSINRALGKNK
jgi:Zn-dependent alcohol dehydrogenase